MRKIILFSDNWLFNKPGEAQMPVRLPHTWNAADGQDGVRLLGLPGEHEAVP